MSNFQNKSIMQDFNGYIDDTKTTLIGISRAILKTCYGGIKSKTEE